jgi:molybdate transport system regulatory protein
MKTSARNTFAGTVSSINKGAVNAEVELTTKGGSKIVAIITNTSVDALGLAVGKPAFALVKASWSILGTDLHAHKLSARNVLCGTLSGLHHGAVNTEIEIALPGGDTLTSIITESSFASLGLKMNDHICAAFKASSVILAVE